MLCYRCGSALGAGQFCLRCGADVRIYRRIVRLSNRYYNYGLEKAKVRDLSGAAEELSRALEIDKKNIQARNLLGLVLYEMGETVQALCEWVISTHYQENDNPASAYVDALRDDKTELDTASQGIRKFNFALDYAKKGSEDLAIIQLEWVVANHPKMIKAHALLALLYYSEGQYSRAEKEITAVLRRDVRNTFCLNLAKEMSEDIRTPQISRHGLKDKVRSLKNKAEEEGEKLRRSMNTRSAFLIKTILTALILMCLLMGVMIPTLERRRSRAVSEAVARYSEELEGIRSRLDDTEGLKTAYGVFLKMNELDPLKEEELQEIRVLFEGLGRDDFRDELYGKLYDSWEQYIPILEQEAESRAAAETASSEEESTEEPESGAEDESSETGETSESAPSAETGEIPESAAPTEAGSAAP